MWDNKGNFRKETSYQGYGVFGDKDYFMLLYEMNSPEDTKEKIRNAEKRKMENVDEYDEEFEKMRDEAIEMYYSNDASVLFPNLTEKKNWVWKNEKPKDCHYQGNSRNAR